MSTAPIRAITFDFWRTLFYASSRSKERKAERLRVLSGYLGLPEEQIAPALKHVSTEFQRVHIYEQRTPHPSTAAPMIGEQLGRAFTAGECAAITDAITNAFLVHPPEPIPGALDAVRAAAKLVPVGLISDTGLTPGSRLRTLLEREGFAPHFTSLSFSDEIGVAKPQPAMFHHAAHGLGVAVQELLHIGDLEPTDVAGAINVGAFPALFAGDNTRYVAGTRARRVFGNWQEFIDALGALVGNSPDRRS
jgi:putative hydrolase of the HAD superfamily